MTKKIVALLLALVLVFAMTACAKTETPAPSASTATDAPAAETPDEPAADEPATSDEIVTLKYYWCANQDTSVRPQVEAAINEHIEPLIGADVEFTLISWGDWDNKAR